MVWNPSRNRRRYWLTALSLIALALLAGCGRSSGTTRGTATAEASRTATPGAPLDAGLAAQSVYVASINGLTVKNPGVLASLNAQTGAVRWTFAPSGMAAAPVFSGGGVFVAPEDDHVYAMDAATGKQRWSYTRPDGSTQVGFDGYSAVSGTVDYVTCDAGSVYALTIGDGSLKWHITLPNVLDHVYAAPAVANGLVYISVGGVDDELLALDAATGRQRWKVTSNQEFDGVPLAMNGMVYVGADDSMLYAIDGTTGAVRWRFSATDVILTRPAVGNGVVYFGSRDQTVYAVNATTGKQIWSFKTSGSAPLPPLPTGAAVTLEGDTLYAGGQGGTLYALNTADGSVHWQRNLGGAIDSPVAIADGAVFAATDTGTLYALRASDGAPSWQYSVKGTIFASPEVG